MSPEREYTYRGHGISVDAEGNLFHDLDDEKVLEVRRKALDEIQSMMDKAAPGAARIKRLEEARGIITRRLLNRSEDKGRRRKAAEHLLEIMRDSDNTPDKYAEAALRLLGEKDYGIPGLLNKGEKVTDTLTEDEIKDAEAVREEWNEIMTQLDEIDIESDAEALKWAEQHGSPRLQGLIRESIEWERVYLDERLAFDRPHWKWGHELCGKIQPPHGPSVTEEHIKSLDLARIAAPDAKLGWVGKGPHKKGCEGHHWNERADDVDQRMILYANFLKRFIFREVPVDPKEDIPF